MTNAGRAGGWGRGVRALLGVLCLGSGAWAMGQGPPEAPVPARPLDGVYDDARVFSEEQRRAAAAAIADARKDGVSVYVAAFTFIVGETIEQRAERLKAAWCGNEIGLIVVVDASTSQCTYLSHLSDRDWLSSDQLRRIFEEATAVSISKRTPGERLLSVVEHLVPQMHSALVSRRAAVQKPGSFRQWMVFGGVIAACAMLLLATWVAFRLGRRVQAHRPEPAFFPTVAVEPRFGAAFAGGVAAEVEFGSATPQGISRVQAP
jgi:hypothetical protein